jgi:hypothetical protein
MHKSHEAIFVDGQMFDLEARGRADQLIRQFPLCSIVSFRNLIEL